MTLFRALKSIQERAHRRGGSSPPRQREMPWVRRTGRSLLGQVALSIWHICVSPTDACNGVLHCPLSGDDESICERQCPKECSCLRGAIFCINPIILQHNTSSIAVLRFHSLNFMQENAWFVDRTNSHIPGILPIQSRDSLHSLCTSVD